MRDVFAPTTPMPKDNFDMLFEGGEVARFSAYVLEKFQKAGTPTYDQKLLREDVVRELKVLRAKIKKKEVEVLPLPLHEACVKVVWGQW